MLIPVFCAVHQEFSNFRHGSRHAGAGAESRAVGRMVRYRSACHEKQTTCFNRENPFGEKKVIVVLSSPGVSLRPAIASPLVAFEAGIGRSDQFFRKRGCRTTKWLILNAVSQYQPAGLQRWWMPGIIVRLQKRYSQARQEGFRRNLAGFPGPMDPMPGRYRMAWTGNEDDKGSGFPRRGA